MFPDALLVVVSSSFLGIEPQLLGQGWSNRILKLKRHLPHFKGEDTEAQSSWELNILAWGHTARKCQSLDLNRDPGLVPLTLS